MARRCSRRARSAWRLCAATSAPEPSRLSPGSAVLRSRRTGQSAARLPPARVVVAGAGPLRLELESLARRSGDRVTFAGPVDDISALVEIASCVVSTSSWEGLPLALLEALSLGAPVVATAVDGVTDIVPPGAAVLVPPGDPVAIAAGISRILDDAEWSASLRRGALAASSAWHPDRMLHEYRLAYERAATSRERAARVPA
jgi:glycosyltransferase involved in cell wall biosynthesis